MESKISDQLENLMVVYERPKLQDRKVKQPKTKFSNSRAITSNHIQFTWLGVHKLYRGGLVGCNTYITDPLKKLCTMSFLLLLISLVNVFTKPYKDKKTNRVAVLSYAANVCIAVINLIKTII